MIHRLVQRDRRSASPERLLDILKGFVVTEKSTLLTQDQKYTFHVNLNANKFEIRQALQELLGVKVKAVNTVKLPGKEKVFRGKKGTRSAMKKAVVTLQEGQTIDMGAGVKI